MITPAIKSHRKSDNLDFSGGTKAIPTRQLTAKGTSRLGQRPKRAEKFEKKSSSRLSIYSLRDDYRTKMQCAKQ